MAWSDVPAKLATYAAEEYAPEDADLDLLREFEVPTLDVQHVPEHRREEFEQALDYRLGACQNVKASRGTRWHL